MSVKTNNNKRKVTRKNPPSAAAGIPMAESTKKPKNYSGFEDEIFCRAYVSASTNPLVGIDQKLELFWKDVKKRFLSLCCHTLFEKEFIKPFLIIWKDIKKRFLALCCHTLFEKEFIKPFLNILSLTYALQRISSSNPLKFLGFFVDSAMGTTAAADGGFFLVTFLFLFFVLSLIGTKLRLCDRPAAEGEDSLCDVETITEILIRGR
jgi:hypothetical protein